MTEQQQPKKDHWFRDMMVYGQQLWLLLVIPIIAILASMLLPALARIKAMKQKPVILYCAQDQVFAEPLLKDFEQETGIHVSAVYDSEAVKTVGLANRLAAEKSHPQADVFWGNEEFRTRQLVEQGVFTNGFTPLAGYHRLRQIVINTNFVAPLTRPSDTLSPSDGERAGVRGSSLPTELLPAPRSLDDLTNSIWRSKVALAYPLFGTTATHFLALRQAWGEARWRDWCHALLANKALVVDGNSVVVRLVGQGEAWVGLTDSDDIASFQREGLPVAPINFAETLRIPNTAAVVTGAPHPDNATRLVAFLNSEDTKHRLAEANAFAPVKPDDPLGLRVDWDAVLRDQVEAIAELKEIFLR